MRIVRKATEHAVVFMFAVLVGVVFFQVVARYLFNRPPAWTEELARYCQVWIILLTSPVCIRKGSHLAVDYLGHRLNARVRMALDICVHLLIAAYVAVVLVYGVQLMVVGRFQVSPAMGIPMSLIYSVFPLAGALMLGEAVLRVFRLFKAGRGAR